MIRAVPFYKSWGDYLQMIGLALSQNTLTFFCEMLFNTDEASKEDLSPAWCAYYHSLRDSLSSPWALEMHDVCQLRSKVVENAL